MSDVDGFIDSPPQVAGGKPLKGRLVCEDIQWTGVGEDLFGTFTITARELLNAAESNLLWTDQGVQRGVKPERSDSATELSLNEGYPDEEKYIFVGSNADDIVDKLLFGKRLFLSPLIWNLRPGKFEGFKDDADHSFHLYDGKVYLPDSHHRHQAIIKAAKIYRDAPNEYKSFSLDKQFKVELYFLSREDEGNYFFDKNQRTRQTARSKAYDLTTEDALSLLAKAIIESSQSLSGNVNRVTDRLTSKNPQVITLSTLREMTRSIASDDYVDESEIEGLATIAGSFFDMLAEVRPELGKLSVPERKQTRETLLVDSAVMMHGYARLIKDYINDIAKLGAAKAKTHWETKLQRLSSKHIYRGRDWTGDLFSKANPMWIDVGILKPNAKRTGFSQVNNGATRSESARVLRSVLNADPASTNVADFVVRSDA